MKLRVLSTIGCVVGLLGVFAAVLAHHVISRPPEQPPGWEVEVNIAESLKWRYGNLPPTSPKPTPVISRDSMAIVAIATGCIAFAFAVASWIRREGIALGVLASFLGVAAIAWEHVLIIFALFVIAGGPAVWIHWLRAEHKKSSQST